MLKILSRLATNKLAFIGGVIVVLLVLTAVLAPIISPYDYEKNDTDNRFALPFQSSAHILGTDELGRDILSRIIYGSQVSLMVAVESVLFAFIFGSIPAILAASKRFPPGNSSRKNRRRFCVMPSGACCPKTVWEGIC